MARPGSGKRKMQAVITKRNKKTDAFARQLYKFLAAVCTGVALMFKYMFIAMWWAIKQMFICMYKIMLYIYRGAVTLVKKIAEKIRGKRTEE